MNEWQILPQPQGVTQLYFTHYQQLPASFAPGAMEKVAFTVRNLEHQTTAYRYQVVAASAKAGAERVLADGSFTLAHDKSLATSRTITVPSLGTRVAVKVNLQYKRSTPENTLPSLQAQSIHYWVSLIAPSAGGKEKHEAS
jgi:hypothetical protein